MYQLDCVNIQTHITYHQTHQTQGIYGDTQSHRHRHTLTPKTFRSHSAVWHAKAAFFRSADVLVGAVGAALGWPLGRSSVMNTTYNILLYHCQTFATWCLLVHTCTVHCCITFSLRPRESVVILQQNVLVSYVNPSYPFVTLSLNSCIH